MIACLAALVFTVVVVLVDNGIINKRQVETAKWNAEDAASAIETENLEVTVADDVEDDASFGGASDANSAATQNGLPKDGVATDLASESGLPEEETIKDVTMIFAGDICFYDAFANMSALRSRGGNIESSVDEKLLAEGCRYLYGKQ